MYKPQDLKGNNIQGYNSELLAVDNDADSLWFNETILKKRRKTAVLC